MVLRRVGVLTGRFSAAPSAPAGFKLASTISWRLQQAYGSAYGGGHIYINPFSPGSLAVFALEIYA